MADTESQVPLIDELHNLGAALAPSETPIASQVPQVLGAVIKVLDHAGVNVANELYPPEPVAVPRPETAQQVHQTQTNDRLARLESAIADLVSHVKGDSTGGTG